MNALPPHFDPNLHLRIIQLQCFHAGKGFTSIIRGYTGWEGEAKDFRVNKHMIAGCSKVLDALFESANPNAVQARENFWEPTPILHAALCFMYTKHYPTTPFDVEIIQQYAPSETNIYRNMFICHAEMFLCGVRLRCSLLQNNALSALVNEVFRIKRYEFPNDPEEFPQIVEFLTHVYGNTPTNNAIRQVAAWLSVAHINGRILDNPIPELAPNLMEHHNREQKFMDDAVVSACEHCERRLQGGTPKSTIVEERDGQLQWVHCFCHFRGVCSTRCLIGWEPDTLYDFPCNARRQSEGPSIIYKCTLTRKNDRITCDYHDPIRCRHDTFGSTMRLVRT